MGFNYNVSWISLGLSYLGFAQLLELVGLCFLPHLGSFQPLFLQGFFSPSPLLPGLQWHECRLFCYSSKRPFSSVHLFSIYFVSVIQIWSFCFQSSSSLTFFSPLTPSFWGWTYALVCFVFLIWVILFFSSQMFIWFSFTFSSSEIFSFFV